MSTEVLIRDVTLRDGLQDEAFVPTSDKVALYEALTRAGVRDLELTSFVRRDRVPALADAERLTADTASDRETVRWGLVLNRRGAERALSAGIGNVQFVLSASETHNGVNAGRTVAESVRELEQIVTLVGRHGGAVEATVATAFGCPYEGPIDPARVRRTVEDVLRVGANGIGLADTIGTGLPTEVGVLVRAISQDYPDVPLGVHLHDTRGLALANALQALEAGATRLDGSVGGLGGCPFAPGASGNLALEDLVHALDEMGIKTGVNLDGLLTAARLACDLTGRTIASHIGLAGRRFAHLAVLESPEARTPREVAIV